MMPSLKMILDMGTLEVDFHMYQMMIKKLNFLIPTQLDITFVLNQVSRFSNQTKILHSNEVKDLLMYINGEMNLGIHYHQGEAYELASFLNANWASDVHDWKSTIDMLFCLDRAQSHVEARNNIVQHFLPLK